MRVCVCVQIHQTYVSNPIYIMSLCLRSAVSHFTLMDSTVVSVFGSGSWRGWDGSAWEFRRTSAKKNINMSNIDVQ